jgi:transposase
MAMSSPYQVVLTDEDRRVLIGRSRSERAAHRDVQRAAIVLAAADDTPNAQIARRLAVCEDTVRKWRARFCREGLAGLADRPRPGRQRTFPKTAEAEVKALACELPAESEVPLSRWSISELAAEAVTRGVVNSISPSTVGRWLRRRDPPVAVPVVDLPPRPAVRPQGRPCARSVRPCLGRPTPHR